MEDFIIWETNENFPLLIFVNAYNICKLSYYENFPLLIFIISVKKKKKIQKIEIQTKRKKALHKLSHQPRKSESNLHEKLGMC